MSERWGFDEPRGVIVGAFVVRYKFIQENKTLHDHHIKNDDGKPIMDVVADQYFENDQEALDWFAANYPAEWADRKERPIEMRVFDQPGKHEQSMIDVRKARQP